MDSPDYKNRTSSTPTRDRRARRIAPHRIGETSIYVFSRGDAQQDRRFGRSRVRNRVRSFADGMNNIDSGP